MGLEQKICGYTLGRFVASRRSFLATAREQAAGGPVFLQVVSHGTAVRGDDDVLDVGRAPNGNLVVVKMRSPSPLIRLFGEEHIPPLHPRGAPDRGVNPVLFERAVTFVEPEKDPSTPNTTHGQFGAHFQSPFLTGSRGGDFTLSSVMTSVVTAVRISTRGLIGRRRRLAGLFVLVGASVLMLSLVVISNDEAREDTAGLNIGTTSTQGPVTRDNVPIDSVPTEDPVAFALAQAHAGKISSLMDAMNSEAVTGTRTRTRTSESTSADATDSVAAQNEGVEVQGRIVSRTGDFVLVEVSVIAAGETTIATLLLQSEENGWRTRDVFDAAS